MTQAMKSWLPETALEQCSPEPLLQHVVQQWGEHWLVDAKPSLAALYQDDWPLFSASLKWRSFGTQCIAFREPAYVLASAMLGCSIIPASLQPTDQRILDSLTQTAIDDLLVRIAALGGASLEEISSSPIDTSSCAWWEISVAPGKPAFKLAIANSTLMQLIKRELPDVDKLALEPIHAGLARQEVLLGAGIGHCRINLADLKQLGVGDVLVLDRLTETPVDVIVDGRPSPFRATFDEIEGSVLLVVAPKEVSNV